MTDRQKDLIGRNREAMRLFEKCINTNDIELGRRLIAETAAFKTPVSPTPLYGAEGYLSVVSLMRKSFPDVQWKLVDMVADEKTVAVQWECSGTFNGKAPFAGLQPNGRRFSTTVMNFYSFDADGKICKDVAATGIAGILQVGFFSIFIFQDLGCIFGFASEFNFSGKGFDSFFSILD